jgi:hypothetical protein
MVCRFQRDAKVCAVSVWASGELEVEIDSCRCELTLLITCTSIICWGFPGS